MKRPSNLSGKVNSNEVKTEENGRKNANEIFAHSVNTRN